MTLPILFGTFLVLLLLEVPVAFTVVLSAFAALTLGSEMPLQIVVQRISSGLDSFPLLAIPLFVLAGNILNGAGIADRIFAFSTALVGHIRGGLAQVNIMASMIFAGMSGVAQADAAGLGTIEIKHMKARGYDAGFAAAVTAASSIIGPVIPPSVIMVIYAVTAQVPLTDLFLAGIVPGVLMGLALMTAVYVLARRSPGRIPVEARASWLQVLRTFRAAIPALLAPVLLTAGMLSGAATPTELGALTVLYAVVLGFCYRDLTWRSLLGALKESAVTTGILTLIIAAAIPFGWIISVNNVPGAIVESMTALSDEPWVLLLIINLCLLLVGLFMETTAVLLIATPALMPVIGAYGIDPVHFGVVMVINLLVGALTPPFGVILFICKHIAAVSFGRMVRAILPFYIPLAAVLLLVTYVPQLTLWLPAAFK
ncbi:TRAP transporter large permease [Bordetella sp. 2513F-2]